MSPVSFLYLIHRLVKSHRPSQLLGVPVRARHTI
jgi:hypothetical protein